MAKEYLSVRALAAEAGVSVQAVYKWIEKGELKAEVVRISEVEKRYRVELAAATRFLRSHERAPKKSAPRKVAAKTGVKSMARPKAMTAKDLLESGRVGMWADREDIGDSVAFARKLRKQASTRGFGPFKRRKEPMTGKEILESGIVGMWEDREDIKDNLEFARELRKRASARRRG